MARTLSLASRSSRMRRGTLDAKKQDNSASNRTTQSRASKSYPSKPVKPSFASCKYDHYERILLVPQEINTTFLPRGERRVDFNTVLQPDPTDKNWIPYLRVCRERFAWRLHNPILARPNIPHTFNKNLKIISDLPSSTLWAQRVVWDHTERTLKTLRFAQKRIVSNKFQTPSLLYEKNLMFCSEFPFVADFFEHFHTPTTLFMTLEYFPGGNLRMAMNKSRKISQDRAKFYSAQIVLALEYLHAMNVILRGLTLDDVWICRDGYVKIANFSTATTLKDNLKLWVKEGKTGATSDGNLSMLPPEIWVGSTYGLEVDWWLFGLFVYRLYSGDDAFPEEQRSHLYEEQMRKKIFDLHYDTPRWFSAVDRNLFRGFLVLDPQVRLGGGDDGVSAVKNHPWFKGTVFF